MHPFPVPSCPCPPRTPYPLLLYFPPSLPLITPLPPHPFLPTLSYPTADSIHSYWIWGYWISPLAYTQNALSVNEFLAPRWNVVSGGQ